MKQAQLLSVVFSLIMFTGLTAGTAVAYAESDDDDWDIDDMLDRYCEMSEETKAEFIANHTKASDHKDKMDEYCTIDESEREAFIEEHEDEYKKHDYDIEDFLEKYCEMTAEEKADFEGKHNKTEDHKSAMEEYCTLDESEREAFIEEHEDEYEKDHDYRKHDYNMKEKMNEFCEMSEEDITALIEDHPLKEEHLAEMEEYCSLDDVGRNAFIEEHKDDYKDKMSEHKDDYKDKMSDQRDDMKDKISEHKARTILRASTLTDEQKDDVKTMYAELRDFKHSLRDKSISDSDKQIIRDQFMNMTKEFSMTWLSPRHQVAAGIDSQQVECREGFALVMKTSNASPMCVKETTAEKLIQRGIAISAI